MRLKRVSTVLAAIAILFTGLMSCVMAEDLIIVSTEPTFQDAQAWIEFLKSKEIPIRSVLPQGYSTVSNEKYIVLMGGMDEPDGIKNIVKELLTKEEFRSVLEGRHGKVFRKYIFPKVAKPSQLWGAGQNFIIFVGTDRRLAAEARRNSQQVWWEELCVWFDIDESPTMPRY